MSAKLRPSISCARKTSRWLAGNSSSAASISASKTPRAKSASGPASGEGKRSSSIRLPRLATSFFPRRNKSVIRFFATCIIHAPACAMGFIIRCASPPAPAPALPVQGSSLVQRQIQLQNVDARLAQECRTAGLRCWRPPVAGPRPALMPRAAATRADLGFRRCGADVGIEPAAGSRQQVGRHRAGERGVLGAELLQVALHPVDQLLVGGAEVRAAGRQAVVAIVAGGRGAAVEILGPGEVLADQLRADDLAVGRDQAAVGLVRENDLWPGR